MITSCILSLGCESGSEATAGGSGGSGGSTGAGLGGGGGIPDPNLPDACPTQGAVVAGCVQGPSSLWQPDSGLSSGTVVSVGTPAAGCFELNDDTVLIGQAGQPGETWLTVDVPGHGLYTLALAVPGFDDTMVTAGMAVELAVSHQWADEYGPTKHQIELYASGALLAFVGENTASPIDVAETGTDLCFQEDLECGYGGRDMLVSHNGAQATVGWGSSAEVGGLLVTNQILRHVYDTQGYCEVLGWHGYTPSMLFKVGAAPGP